MTTARTALGGLLAPALAPALWPGDAAAHTCDDPFSTDLIAGRTIDAGEVKVCNDDTTLTVTFDATFPWCLLETNLHVATSEPEIPQNKAGNPVPGHFAYSDEHDCVEIDGGAIPGDTVVIAAHAEVDDGERQEGAWGTRFVERGNLGDVLHLRGAGGDVRRDVQMRLRHQHHTQWQSRRSRRRGRDLPGSGGGGRLLGRAGTYLAWLSDAAASPSTRFTQASVPYKRVDAPRSPTTGRTSRTGTWTLPLSVPSRVVFILSFRLDGDHRAGARGRS